MEALDSEVNYDLFSYEGDPFKPGDLGKPDSALLMIGEIIKKEPKLKYAPHIANHTFSSLLRTNPYKAYEYGKAAIITPTYKEPPYGFIIGNIEWYSDKLNLPSEIYQLGAEAYHAQIEQILSMGNVDISKRLNKMADWYWRACNKLKAIETQQRALEALKSKKNFSSTELDEFETRLQQYKKM